MHVSAIIAAGGRGARFGGARPKQLLTLAGLPILQRSVNAYLRHELVTDMVVALPPGVVDDVPKYLRNRAKRVDVVEGGDRRQDSVARAFSSIASRADIVVIHDAARPLVSSGVISRTIEAAADFGAAVAAVRSTDTVKRGDASSAVVETLPRDEIYLVQTPQAFRVSVLRDAMKIGGDATDEAALVERAGHRVQLVEGDVGNVKITTTEDLALAERLLRDDALVPVMRIGNGYDLHRLVVGRPLILGGVTIPFERGLQGHSDGDAVCHAVTDAILGAAGAGDIGSHFPDDDASWKDANSVDLLHRAVGVVRAAGFGVANVDVVVIAERPKLSRHVDAMRTNLAYALECDPEQVSIKGKTNEGVDSTGAGEAIAVHAVALLIRS